MLPPHTIPPEQVLRHHRSKRRGGKRGRGSTDERWDPADPMNDPYRFLRDEEEELPYPANDEYIWPTLEEEEDD